VSKPNFVTLVIRVPQDGESAVLVQDCLEKLAPFTTAMSLQDEMSVLDFVEEHPEMDHSVLADAREKALALSN
jgi:hypothetical protein